jgi:tetratricopeptide (TPR) repeat protein
LIMKFAAIFSLLMSSAFAGSLEDAALAFLSGDEAGALKGWRQHAELGAKERRDAGRAALLRGKYAEAISLLNHASLKNDAEAQECLSRAALHTGNDELAWEAAKASLPAGQSGPEAERRLRRLLALSQLPPHQAKRTAELTAPDAPPALKAALLLLYSADYRRADAGKLIATLPPGDALCAEVALGVQTQEAIEKQELPRAASLVELALRERRVPNARWFSFLATIRAQAGDQHGVIAALQAWRRADLKDSGPSLLMVSMFGGRPGSGDAFAKDGVMGFPQDLKLLQAVALNPSVSPAVRVSLLTAGWKAAAPENRYVVTKLLAGAASSAATMPLAMQFLESQEAMQTDAAGAAIARFFVLSAAGQKDEAAAALKVAEEKHRGHALLAAAHAAHLGAAGRAAEAMALLEKTEAPNAAAKMEYLWLALTASSKPDARMLTGMPPELAVPLLEQVIPQLARAAKWERIGQILQPAMDSLVDHPGLLIELVRALDLPGRLEQREQRLPILLEALARLTVIHQPPPFADPQKGLLPSDYRLMELMRDESRSLVDQQRQGSPKEDQTAPAVRCLALIHRILGSLDRAEEKLMIRRVNGIQRNTGLPLAENSGTNEVVLPHYQQHYRELWENSGGSLAAALWLVHRWDAPAIPHAAAELIWKGDHGVQEWRDAAAHVLAVHEGTADPAPFLELCFKGEAVKFGRFVPRYFWPAFATKLATGVQLPPALAGKIGSELGIGRDEMEARCAFRLRAPEELAAYIKDRFAGVHGSSEDYTVFSGGDSSLTWLQKSPEAWAREKMAATLPHLANASQRLHLAILSGLEEETKAALKEVMASTSPDDVILRARCAFASGDVAAACDAWLKMEKGTSEYPWPESEAAHMALLAWSLEWEVPADVLKALRERKPASLTLARQWYDAKELLPLMLNGEKASPEQTVILSRHWRPLLPLMSGLGEQERGADVAATFLRRAVAASFKGWQEKDSLFYFKTGLGASGLAGSAWEKLITQPDAESRWAAGYIAAKFSHQLKKSDDGYKLLEELKTLEPLCPLLAGRLR